MKTALEALLDYQQADMDGVMVLTSREAIHAVADEIERLRGLLRGWSIYEGSRELKAETAAALRRAGQPPASADSIDVHSSWSVTVHET